MNSKFSLRARWVLTMDGPPIDGGEVTIADGHIESVHRGLPHSGSAEDLGDVVLLPGFVNAHTHLEFSQLRQPLGNPGMQLPDWIRLVIAERKRSDRDVAAAISQGLTESVRQGVTTIGEIATVVSQEAYAQEVMPRLVAFQEVIGFSTARMASVLADGIERLASSPADTTQGISPHAPYTVHPQLVSSLVDLALKKNIPVAMHLAETREELQLLANNDGPFRELLEERSMWDAEAIPVGSRPLDYLQVLARAPQALVIHGNYLAPDEMQFLAEHRQRMALVYCPRTHAYFKHATYPLRELLAAGVRVVLGTDSRASNPNLSLLDEMRSVYREHQELAPEQILEMGTTAGAEALGLDDVTGTIACGKEANLTTIACNIETADPAEAVLASDKQPVRTWVRGQEVRAISEKA
ncbi:MAG: amidohydrolase family protein [Pirellulales bacterium]|nr:amidohydrolase family protein [Pirellulales bacterium]